MTPEAFVSKWSETTTKERAAAQEHFIDLCRVVGDKTPNEADPKGEWYAFEKGVEKTGASRGWADVWKRGHFGWEYKSKSGGRVRTMSDALKQLQLYSLALESPPLLIVSDIDTIEIHTAFQNAVQEVHHIELSRLAQPENIALLKFVFHDPEKLRPSRTRDQITSEAAGEFAQLASELRGAGHDSHEVAHFINKILFCMFAEDVGILKTGIFTDIAEKGVEHPEHFDVFVKRLFQAMQNGGPFGTEIIDWFNGGLYDDDKTLPLTLEQIRSVRDISHMDWSQIEPAIFGTLFERGLDPQKRSQLGAHYTDSDSIMRIIRPTIIEPLEAEWELIKADISVNMERMEKVKTKAAAEKRRKAATDMRNEFIERLRNFRILDPACGSGNFLYIALLALKDIEHRVNIESEAMGLLRQNPLVDPENVLGIELSRYAAELARVSVWIGEIQWMLEHGYAINRKPILKSLDNIEQRDAILNHDGTEPQWPEADVIVGNPPFLGGSKLLGALGQEYTDSLRKLYDGRVPGAADYVTYWFDKANTQIKKGETKSAGLVSTQSIRKGASRAVLDAIYKDHEIYNAWADESWTNEGADVRVSLVCFTSDTRKNKQLNGKSVDGIFSDLSADTGSSIDITSAKVIETNRNYSFEGVQKNGPFDVTEDIARQWIGLPNPNDRSNADVLKPYFKASDVTGRPKNNWMVDFTHHTESSAMLYEAPFRYIIDCVKPIRDKKREKYLSEKYWLLKRSAPDMRDAISGLSRYVATPRVSKHRFFCFLDSRILPDSRLNVISREDYECFGILSSSVHTIWSLKTASRHGVGNDPTYNAKSCFGTFPFPAGITLELAPENYKNRHASSIAGIAKELNELRENWLNPKQWANRIVDPAGIAPDFFQPKVGFEDVLKKRTLTILYNEQPSWLGDIHRKLDEAVVAAYGWLPGISDEEILANLLKLNLERAGVR